ncbi:MAG: LysR family transcriptional regulator [Firmicutes bacterium]|nr:LysR family transcriptional regulator [Bacillota bacterium]
MLRQIQYFRHVVEQKSYSEAAEICHISQSAVSQQIKQLENELGVQLIIRHGRSFELTEAGKYFYQKSLILLTELDQLIRDTRRIDGGDLGQIRIGYPVSYSGTELSRAVAVFSEQYPDISLTISLGSHEDLYIGLISGKLDLTLSEQRRMFSEDYHNLVLADAYQYIEIVSHHLLSHLSSVEVSSLSTIPCILVATPGQEQTEADYYKGILGINGDILFAGSVREARMMAAAGKGYLLLEGTMPFSETDMPIKPILLTRRDKPIIRKYFACWSKDNSGYYIETFAEILQKQFKKPE